MMMPIFKPLRSAIKRFFLSFFPKNRRKAGLSKEEKLFKALILEVFDRESYLKNNPDVKLAGVDPVEHWFNFGMQEGRFISSFVNVAFKPSAAATKGPGWQYFSWQGSAVAVRVRKIQPKTLQLAQYGEVVILTTKHCIYVAELIRQSLSKIRINASIITECPQKGFKQVPHFVICPQMFSNLPELYIAFQMEQTVNSRWFTEKYFAILRDAYAIFDYSITNIGFLQKHGFGMQQIYYMPIDYLKNYHSQNDQQEKKYDVIFYGDTNNARRQSFINKIKEHYSVKIINNLFGAELLNEVRKAKVLINIHYYEDALLETTRINECLSLNSCIIVSEKSKDFAENKYLENVVDFVDVDDAAAMLERINYWLQDDARRNKKLQANRDFLDDKANSFEYYFFRFLLSVGSIDFDEFYCLAGGNIKFQGNKICLGLPESTERKTAFEQDNKFGFEYFPGLRHPIGWIGCGLSYKFIMKKAMEQKLPQLTVCEDDVLFPDSFQERFLNISKYLQEHQEEWHLFSGLLADLSDVKIKGIVNYNDEKLVYINKMVSMVFNVYNQSFYQYFLEWDEKDKDNKVITIDRFLERQKNLKIVTTSPFLVGHKEELYSILWGFKNTSYNDKIQKSNDLLRDKTNEYITQEGIS